MERLRQRDIHIIDYQHALLRFTNKYLCLFLWYSYLSPETKPFVINIKTKDIILVLNRRDDNVWIISTVLNPKKNTIYMMMK